QQKRMFVLFYEIAFGLGREAHAIGEKMSQSGIVSARSRKTVAADCMGDEALGSHTRKDSPRVLTIHFRKGKSGDTLYTPRSRIEMAAPVFRVKTNNPPRRRRVHNRASWMSGVFPPRALVVPIRLQPLAALVLRHLESAF